MQVVTQTFLTSSIPSDGALIAKSFKPSALKSTTARANPNLLFSICPSRI